MESVGYIWRPGVFTSEPMSRVKMTFENPSSMRQELLSTATKNIDEFLQSVSEERAGLESYVQTSIVCVDPNRMAAFQRVLDSTPPNTCILVESFVSIGLDAASQLRQLEYARNLQIIVISIFQTSILKLNPELAFETQEQLVVMPLRDSVAAHRSKAEAQYDKMKDLMLAEKTVDVIARELGQSKMTIFRWRKLFEERLSIDVPGFKIGD